MREGGAGRRGEVYSVPLPPPPPVAAVPPVARTASVRQKDEGIMTNPAWFDEIHRN